MRLVEQNTHHLGNGHGWVCIVELDSDLVGQAIPIGISTSEAGDNISQRAANQKVFLDEAQRLAGGRRVVGIKDARHRLGKNPVDHGVDEIAGAELAEVEIVWRCRLPETQGINRPTAIANDGAVVRHPEQIARMSGRSAEGAILEMESAIDW